MSEVFTLGGFTVVGCVAGGWGGGFFVCLICDSSG